MLSLLALAAVSGAALLRLWRARDDQFAEAAWQRLASLDSRLPDVFETEIIADLPEPARRYFSFAIRPGTRLSRIAVIEMAGEIGLGTADAPAYQPMTARQILAAPEGLVWQLRAGRGWLRLSGSDGLEGELSWVRFWLHGLAPVVRAGGSTDHLRSAFGRVAAEAAFWTPAALLPQMGVTWEQLGPDKARAKMKRGLLEQSIDISVAKDGRPESVIIPRWTNANPDKQYRLQPFGGTLGDFREVAGFRLPFAVDGGNHFGTPDYFPFYRARVQSIRMIDRALDCVSRNGG